jgi:hypothetical protein
LTCEFTGVFEDFILVLPGAGADGGAFERRCDGVGAGGGAVDGYADCFLKLKDKAYFDETF